MKLLCVSALFTSLVLHGCAGKKTPDKPVAPVTCDANCGNFDYKKGDYQQCTICFHVYDERDGCLTCPTDASKPCTTEKGCTSKKFEALPDNWLCPVCRNPKSKYQKVTVAGDVKWVDSDAEDGYTPAGGACKPVGSDGKALSSPTSTQSDFCNGCLVNKCKEEAPKVESVGISEVSSSATQLA